MAAQSTTLPKAEISPSDGESTVSASSEPWMPYTKPDDLVRTLVVIPAFRQHHLTEALVRDCLREPVGILVIDNSGDYKPIRDEQVLRPGINLGWLKANNLGIGKGLQCGKYDRFVLLNNDLRLSVNFFAGILWTELTSGASIIGVSYDGWWKIQRPDEVKQDSFLPAQRYAPQAKYLPYGACDGACLSIHRRVFDAVGLLDERAFGRFGWAATTDLCFRARDVGMTTGISRAAFANHLDGGRHTARAVFGPNYESLAEAEGAQGMINKWGADWRQSRLVATTKPCVVYTAITGGRDTLKDPQFVPPGWKCVCFTDVRGLRSSIWEIRPLAWSSPNNDPRRTARWHKINAHKLFPNDPISIWADASVRVTADWRQLLWYLGSFSLASYKHYMRDCLYSEAQECIRLGLDDPSLIVRQVERYRNEGYPKQNGLLETTILLRRHLNPEMVAFAELWWKELNEGSKRDQISVNYAAWKLNVSYGLIDDTLRASQWLVRERRR